MKIKLSSHSLLFKYPFKIAHGVRSSTPIVILELEHEGITGYGEACMPPYLGESQESVMHFIKKATPLIKEINPLHFEEILKAIDALEYGNTAAKAAIDIALHDLKGKLLNTPCWELMKLDALKTPFTSFTLGIDEEAVLIKKLEEANAFRLLKVKLNGDDDKRIIETIRQHTSQPIAVDVNQGWKTKEEALDRIEWLTNKQVLFVEQPLLKNNLDDAHWLFERSPLPIYADEAVQRYDDLLKIQGCYHGINIKLMKCTGMLEAHRMMLRARELQFKILIGCMSETSCAISAAAQLSPLADYADLDGCLLIKNDLFCGVSFTNGKIELNNLPGIGIKKL